MHNNSSEPFDIDAPKHKRYWNKPKSVRAGSLYPVDLTQHPPMLIVPSLKLRGMWLLDYGIRSGTEVRVNIVPEGILLTVAPPPGAVAPKVRKMGRRQLARLQAAALP